MPHEFDSLWWHSHQIVYCGRHWSRMPAPSSEKWMNRHFRKTLRLFEIVSDLAAGFFFFLKNFYNASVVIIWKHKFSNSLKTIIIINILPVDMPQALQHWSWTLIWCNLHSRRWICNFTNWAKYEKKFTDSISSSGRKSRLWWAVHYSSFISMSGSLRFVWSPIRPYNSLRKHFCRNFLEFSKTTIAILPSSIEKKSFI